MYSESISVSQFKAQARAEGVRLRRELSGNYLLPEPRQYWTLCARQTKADDSEINQLVYAGLISPWQFNGVDRDALRAMGFANRSEWRLWCKSGKRPPINTEQPQHGLQGVDKPDGLDETLSCQSGKFSIQITGVS